MSDPRAIVAAQVVDTLGAGGGERVAVEIANGLAERGLTSCIVATRAGGSLERALDPRVRCFVGERRRRWDWSGARAVARFLDEQGVRVVHSHNEGSAYLLRLLRRLARRPPAHVVHDHRGPVLGARRRAWLDWLLLRHVDAYVAVSDGLRERAQRLLGLPPARCLFVPNGVPLPGPHPPPDGRPTVVQVANLRRPKAQLVAVRAAEALRRRVPRVLWRLVGLPAEADYAARVEALVRELELEETVEMLGGRGDVGALLAEAHVGALTSDVEALPLALLEYLAAGLPVVITDVGQGPAIVTAARAGSVVPPGDPTRFASAVAELLEQPGRAAAAGQAGRAYVREHFSREAMVERIVALYDELLGERAG